MEKGSCLTKYKKCISILLLSFCAVLVVICVFELIVNFYPNNQVKITNDGVCVNVKQVKITNDGVCVNVKLVDRVSLNDNDIDKLSTKIALSGDTSQGELGELVRVANDCIMFDYTLNGHKYYISTIGNNIKLINEDTFRQKTTIVSIKNLDGLKSFRDQVNSGDTFSNSTVKLSSNIKLESSNWEPIGKYGWRVTIGECTKAHFDGVFDGNNKTISDLVLKVTSPSDYAYLNRGNSFYVGFFGLLKGTVKNLYFTNVKCDFYNPNDDFNTRKANIIKGFNLNTEDDVFNTGYDVPFSVGCLAGSAVNATISNVKINNSYIKFIHTNSTDTTMSGIREFYHVGGLTGVSLNSEFNNCDVAVNISTIVQDLLGTPHLEEGTTFCVGGVSGGSVTMGDIYDTSTYSCSTYTNCLFNGKLQCVGRATKVMIGGISAGELYKEEQDETFKSCVVRNTSESIYLYIQPNAEMLTKENNNNRMYCYCYVSIISTSQYKFCSIPEELNPFPSTSPKGSQNAKVNEQGGVSTISLNSRLRQNTLLFSPFNGKSDAKTYGKNVDF